MKAKFESRRLDSDGIGSAPASRRTFATSAAELFRPSGARNVWREGAPNNSRGVCAPQLARICAALLCFFILQFSFCLRASGQTIDWFNAGAGGGESANGNSSITGTIGQSDAGEMSNGNSSLIGGFWAVADPAFTTLAVASSANPSPPGSNVTFSVSLTNDADIQSPSGGVQFYADGATFGSPVALANNTAGLTTSSLSHAIHSITAAYVGDDNFLSSSNRLSPDESINTLPVAPNNSLGAAENSPANLSAIKLLAQASDADHDTLVVTNVSPASTRGGTVSLVGSTLIYTPPSNFTGSDSFTYTVSDPLGGEASATITVVVQAGAAQPQTFSITPRSDGNMQVTFAGIPNYIYLVQATTNLSPPTWTTISTNTAGKNGLFIYIDLDATNYLSRYYRDTVP